MPYADYTQHLAKNRERQRTLRGAENHLRANREYRRRNRKKLAAHNAVTKALLRGHMEKVPLCATPRCDCTETEAHHPDYDQPLDVVWLCSPHHKEVHRMARKA